MVLTLVLLIHSRKHSFCTFPKTSYLLIFQDLIYSKSALTFQLLRVLNTYYMTCINMKQMLHSHGDDRGSSTISSNYIAVVIVVGVVD
jgi:hypothetical protein